MMNEGESRMEFNFAKVCMELVDPKYDVANEENKNFDASHSPLFDPEYDNHGNTLEGNQPKPIACQEVIPIELSGARVNLSASHLQLEHIETRRASAPPEIIHQPRQFQYNPFLGSQAGNPISHVPASGGSEMSTVPLHDSGHPPAGLSASLAHQSLMSHLMWPMTMDSDTQVFAVVGPLMSTISQNFAVLHTSLQSEFRKMQEDISRSQVMKAMKRPSIKMSSLKAQLVGILLFSGTI